MLRHSSESEEEQNLKIQVGKQTFGYKNPKICDVIIVIIMMSPAGGRNQLLII